MRTGTRTVLDPPPSTSAPATIGGRWRRTASRTFSLCRNQSRAPREKRSYQPASPGPPSADSLMSLSQPRSRRRLVLLLREERRDVAQRLFRTVFVVTVFGRQSFLNRGYLSARLVIRPRRRRDQPQHVATLLEQVLFDGFAHARMAVERELLADLVGHHGLAHDFLAESELAGFGDLDLLLHRAQEPLVRRPRFAGDRVGDFAVVERGLDLVEILVEQLLRLVLERGEQGAVHVLLHPAVVE